MTKSSRRQVTPAKKKVGLSATLEAAGAAGGAAVGATVGMIGGPPGAATGAIAGAIVGAVATAIVERDQAEIDRADAAATDARSRTVTPGRRVAGQRGAFSAASMGTSTDSATQPAEGPMSVPDA